MIESFEDMISRVNAMFSNKPQRPADFLIMLYEYERWKKSQEEPKPCDHVWRHDTGIKGPRCTRCGKPGERTI
jgi:hypothetical protein